MPIEETVTGGSESLFWVILRLTIIHAKEITITQFDTVCARVAVPSKPLTINAAALARPEARKNPILPRVVFSPMTEIARSETNHRGSHPESPIDE
jgi:hypothetical protein